MKLVFQVRKISFKYKKKNLYIALRKYYLRGLPPVRKIKINLIRKLNKILKFGHETREILRKLYQFRKFF